MLKEQIKYIDYDGNERDETFYFNLTKAEVTEMELSVSGGMIQLLEKIVSEKDNVRIIEHFKDLILRSYGEKSPDGKRFIKSKELSDAFSQTEAYSELFMKLATDTEAAITFTKGVMPQHANMKPKENN